MLAFLSEEEPGAPEYRDLRRSEGAEESRAVLRRTGRIRPVHNSGYQLSSIRGAAHSSMAERRSLYTGARTRIEGGQSRTAGRKGRRGPGVDAVRLRRRPRRSPVPEGEREGRPAETGNSGEHSLFYLW